MIGADDVLAIVGGALPAIDYVRRVLARYDEPGAMAAVERLEADMIAIAEGHGHQVESRYARDARAELDEIDARRRAAWDENERPTTKRPAEPRGDDDG